MRNLTYSHFLTDGVMTVMYLFVREKFHWSVRDYTFYETVSHLVPMVGALIGFLILRKVLYTTWKSHMI